MLHLGVEWHSLLTQPPYHPDKNSYAADSEEAKAAMSEAAAQYGATFDAAPANDATAEPAEVAVQ